jgi:diguanylate cyclase (GGDEF)-like protein
MSKKNNFRILIIDDNPAIHQDFIKILEVRGTSPDLAILEGEIFGDVNKVEESALPHFQIDTASQGQEGVERVKEALEEGKPYALAFVDIRMPPGWDGIETIKHIWALDPHIQVVICTAFSDYTWEETIKELGLSDNLLILKKPFDSVSVRQLASALTKKWQLMQQSKVYTETLEKNVQERTSSLNSSLSLTRATLESSADGILVTNNSGKIIDYNQQLIKMWKIPQSMIAPKEFKAILNHMLKQLKAPQEFQNKIEELNKNPEKIYSGLYKFKDKRVFECYTQPQNLEGRIVGRVWSFRDVTKRISLEKKLRKQATHDALTGLPNRILLMDRIQQAISRAERTNNTFGLLFFDLDRFKLVNDSLSHHAGDLLLKKIAKRLLTTFRAEDTLARLGGDEFVVVITDLKKDKSIADIADKLQNIFKEPYKIVKRDTFITASVGISLYPRDGKTVNELLSTADLAMYRAKELGANQFQFYTQGMNKLARLRLKRENELRRAIENDEFFLTYQPQFDLATKKMVSLEALIRWKHPIKGTILPLDFIPLAEETGLIIPIGEWVLKTACKQNKAWQDKGLPSMPVSVNAGSYQFKQPNFVEKVKHILRDTGLKPEYLELEVTENVIVSNPEVMKVIKELRDVGVEVSLDDFGTGNSSLSYLKKVHVDRLKIDQSFVSNIDVDKSDEVIIQAIIDMAHSLDYQVLAEGVETQKQMKFLISKNCQSAQGYYFSKPLSSQEIEVFMKAYVSSPPSSEKK